jgi:hypothetical protein
MFDCLAKGFSVVPSVVKVSAHVHVYNMACLGIKLSASRKGKKKQNFKSLGCEHHDNPTGKWGDGGMRGGATGV